MTAWDITPDTITHTACPEFSASWRSGHIDLETIEGVFYYAENSGQDDQLVFYDFQWQAQAPEPDVFNRVMEEAVTAVDHWISDRM